MYWSLVLISGKSDIRQRTACIASSSFSSSSVLILCLLLFISVSLQTAGQPVHDCLSSSCGEIENIRYPLRLKSDPAECGDTNHELICRGNRTILEFFSEQYYVTNISYNQSIYISNLEMVVDSTASIRVVNANFASGKCALPSRRLVSSEAASISRKYFMPGCWFAFLNCSQKIQNYDLVPCLNRNRDNNNGYTCVKRGRYCGGVETDSLAPSCSFLYQVPIGHEYLQEEGGDEYTDIFKLLQMGFTLVPVIIYKKKLETVADIILRSIKEGIRFGSSRHYANNTSEVLVAVLVGPNQPIQEVHNLWHLCKLCME